eukprot:g30370.t1
MGSPLVQHEPNIPFEAILMGTELGYQPLLSNFALLCILKSPLEDVYPKIQGRMSLTLKCSPTGRKYTCLAIAAQCPFIRCPSVCVVLPMYHASVYPCLQ